MLINKRADRNESNSKCQLFFILRKIPNVNDIYLNEAKGGDYYGNSV